MRRRKRKKIGRSHGSYRRLGSSLDLGKGLGSLLNVTVVNVVQYLGDRFPIGKGIGLLFLSSPQLLVFFLPCGPFVSRITTIPISVLASHAFRSIRDVDGFRRIQRTMCLDDRRNLGELLTAFFKKSFCS